MSADTLLDGDGADTLYGLAGNDVLAGGTGNDTDYTDIQGDQISEYSREGVDTEVRSFESSYWLSSGVENLTLTGTIYRGNGNGNELNNVITGNAADNNLWGMEGNDTLIGGLSRGKLNSQRAG